MNHLVETARKGAKLAFRLGDTEGYPDELDDYLIEWFEGGGLELTNLLYDICQDVVLHPEVLSELRLEEQAAFWKSMGILETALLMPEFWDQAFTQAAYASANRSPKTESDYLDTLLAGIFQ